MLGFSTASVSFLLCYLEIVFVLTSYIYPGMAAQAGSKRRWKDSSEDAAQVESVNCLSQRLARMPSPLITKRMRSSANVPAEVSDPMEGVDGDVLEGQDNWEQSDTDNVTNLFAHGSIMGQVGFRGCFALCYN